MVLRPLTRCVCTYAQLLLTLYNAWTLLCWFCRDYWDQHAIRNPLFNYSAADARLQWRIRTETAQPQKGVYTCCTVMSCDVVHTVQLTRQVISQLHERTGGCEASFFSVVYPPLYCLSLGGEGARHSADSCIWCPCCRRDVVTTMTI